MRGARRADVGVKTVRCAGERDFGATRRASEVQDSSDPGMLRAQDSAGGAMTTRLFHTIVLCGAALVALPTGCGGASDDDDRTEKERLENRCKLEDGTCDEHCSTLAGGECLDPCFVRTDTCAPDCVQPDGSCGWPPTK